MHERRTTQQSAPSSTPGRFLLIVGLSLIVGVLSLFIPDLFYSNQNTYYPHGINLAEPDFLAGDFFVQSQQPHITFAILVGAMHASGTMNFLSFLLPVVLRISLLLGVFLIIRGVLARLVVDDLNTISSVALFVVTLLLFVLPASDLLARTPLVPKILEHPALAEFYLESPYLQPSSFAVLMVPALGLMLHRQHYLAVLLLVVVVNFHFAYALHAGVLVLLAMLWLAQSNRREALITGVLFGVGVLPVTLYSLGFVGDPAAEEANRILALERQPHHAWPQIWFALGPLVKLLLIGTAGILLLRINRFLAAVLLFGLVYTIAGILLVIVTQSYTLAMLHLWRGTALFWPVAQIVLITLAVYAALRLAGTRAKPAYVNGFALLIASAVLLLILSTGHFQVDIHNEPDAIASMIREHTPTGSVILVPASWKEIRLDAERPVYVDWKNHPYVADEVMEWWRRMEFNRMFYNGEVADQDLPELCHDEGIDYFVTGMDAETPTGLVALAQSDEAALFACGQVG